MQCLIPKCFTSQTFTPMLPFYYGTVYIYVKSPEQWNVFLHCTYAAPCSYINPASVVNSTLVNVCNLVEERLKNGAVFIVLLYNTNVAHNIAAPDTLAPLPLPSQVTEVSFCMNPGLQVQCLPSESKSAYCLQAQL